MYVGMWTIALLWIGIITLEDGWQDPDALQTVGFFVSPRHRPSDTAAHLAARRVTRGREPDRVRVGRRALRFEWWEVADVAPRLFEPPHGKHDDGTVMLHLRFTAEATPRPGIRVDSTGWVALWPLDCPTADPGDATIRPELDDALVRLGGARWRPPPAGR